MASSDQSVGHWQTLTQVELIVEFTRKVIKTYLMLLHISALNVIFNWSLRWLLSRVFPSCCPVSKYLHCFTKQIFFYLCTLISVEIWAIEYSSWTQAAETLVNLRSKALYHSSLILVPSYLTVPSYSSVVVHCSRRRYTPIYINLMSIIYNEF